MVGWIKISRDIVNHWLWQDAERLKWWFDLLLMAAWEDRQTMHDAHLFTLRRGQMVASVSCLSDRWGKSHPTIIRFLKMLEDEGMIYRQTLYRQTPIITICNYDKYQVAFDTQVDTLIYTQIDGQVDTQVYTNKEIKNKELINNISSKDDKSGFGETPTLEPVNYNELVKYFNETTKGCFGLLRLPLGDVRKKQIRARVATYGKKSLQTMIVKAVASDFLRGDNHRGFVASFDWMIKPRNYEKILSGNYDNRKGQQSERDNIGSNFVNRE